MMSPRIFLVAAGLLAISSARKCTKWDVLSGGEFKGIPDDCTDLDLYKAGLGDDEAKTIATNLVSNTNLKWLGLSENKISEEGAAALAKALEANKVLTNLKLFDQKLEGDKPEITKATLKVIKKITKKNKDNPYTKEDESKIAAAVREVEVVKGEGVIKHVLEEGTGESPTAGAKVKAHYTGTLANGDKFDSSRDRGQPFEFTLGQGQVIGCWDKGFATMKKGEKALLTCKSDFAYGDRGSPPKIPGGATLKFDVELVDFTGGDKKEL